MLYLPPPEKSVAALRVLGVELRKGQKPPKTWDQYEGLLLSRLVKLCRKGDAKSLVNVLVNDGLLESNPESDLDLVAFLVESPKFLGNVKAQNAHLYLNGKGRAKEKLQVKKSLPTDPRYASLSESQKLKELRSVNLWEWWDSL